MDYYNYITSIPEPSLLALVVQTLDSTIQRVGDHRNQLRYPPDKDLSSG